jgi:hypothetical protein
VVVSALISLKPTEMTAQNQALTASVKASAAAAALITPGANQARREIWTDEADTFLLDEDPLR